MRIPLPKQPKAHRSLSARLLLLTIFFVMLAELFIYTPSIARYRKTFLEERIVRARLTALAVETMPEQAADKGLSQILLRSSENYAIIVKHPDRRLLIAPEGMPPKVDATFDIRKNSFMGWIRDAFIALAQTENRVLRIIGDAPKIPGAEVEVILDEAPMRKSMLDYSKRILDLSIAISLFTATLVYLSLQWMMVRPLRRITENMERFRQAPEDETRILEPTRRSDEIGITQRELAVMQEELRLALKQKDRLAMLGAAVAKVNHDLRNSLATAILVGDRLATSPDPEVQRLMPRMFKAMDRAVALCAQTLDYASSAGPTLDLAPFELADVIDLAGEAIIPPDGGSTDNFEWINGVARDVQIMADSAQLLRVFENLGRNAMQAGATRVRVDAWAEAGLVTVELADNGPGFDEKALEHLFQPFAGSARDGGSGLGLVIAREIVQSHGGTIDLARTGPDGSRFRLRLRQP